MKKFTLDRILVPIDFSRSSLNALDTAIAISQRSGASLVLMQVIESSGIIVSPLNHETVTPPFLQRIHVANENLNVLCKTLSSKHGIAIQYAVEGGITAHTICDYAKRNDCDMIIMGKRSAFSLKKLFIGSTATSVVKNAPCPVMSVPGTRLFTRFKKIVFPVRDAPNMIEKYDIVRPVVTANDSSLVIAGLAKADKINCERVATIMNAVRFRLRYDGLEHTSHMHFCESVPARLLEITVREKPDLIVITAMVSSSLTRILDHYTKSILKRAPCPVLSIRPDMAVLD